MSTTCFLLNFCLLVLQDKICNFFFFNLPTPWTISWALKTSRRKAEPVLNVAGTSSLCLHWKCLEMNFLTPASFVLSVCECVAPHVLRIAPIPFKWESAAVTTRTASSDWPPPEFSGGGGGGTAAHFLN